MLRIRREQIDTLRAVARRRFSDDAVVHLRRQFSEAFARTIDSELRDFVERGVGRARERAIHAAGDVLRYLNLMAVFGPDFDERLPWASAILEDRSIEEPGVRMQLLADEGLRRATEERE